MPTFIKNFFGFLYILYYFRWKVKSSVVDFTRQLREASKLFVCMPKDKKYFEIAQATLIVLKELYPKRQFIVSADVQYTNKLKKHLSKKYLIVIDESQLGFLQLPPMNIVRKVQSHKPEVALDFNTHFDLQSTYLCLISGAPVRMSFSKTKGSQFFNFQVNLNKNVDLEKRYDGIIKYLKNGNK